MLDVLALRLSVPFMSAQNAHQNWQLLLTEVYSMQRRYGKTAVRRKQLHLLQIIVVVPAMLLHDQNDTGGIEQLLPPYTCSNMFGTNTTCLGLMQTAKYHGPDALQII